MLEEPARSCRGRPRLSPLSILWTDPHGETLTDIAR